MGRKIVSRSALAIQTKAQREKANVEPESIGDIVHPSFQNWQKFSKSPLEAVPVGEQSKDHHPALFADHRRDVTGARRAQRDGSREARGCESFRPPSVRGSL